MHRTDFFLIRPSDSDFRDHYINPKYPPICIFHDIYFFLKQPNNSRVHCPCFSCRERCWRLMTIPQFWDLTAISLSVQAAMVSCTTVVDERTTIRATPEPGKCTSQETNHVEVSGKISHSLPDQLTRAENSTLVNNVNMDYGFCFATWGKYAWSFNVVPG